MVWSHVLVFMPLPITLKVPNYFPACFVFCLVPSGQADPAASSDQTLKVFKRSAFPQIHFQRLRSNCSTGFISICFLSKQKQIVELLLKLIFYLLRLLPQCHDYLFSYCSLPTLTCYYITLCSLLISFSDAFTLNCGHNKHNIT